MCRYLFYIFSFIIVGCSTDNSESYDIIDFGSHQTFDVLTWNIENFPKNYEVTTDYVSEFILGLNVDVIALQEIENQNAFDNLINSLGPQWEGYRADDGNWGELSYLINTNFIEIIHLPYTILDEYEHYFAGRSPYVIEVNFQGMNYVIINVHFKCCGDGIIDLDYWDEEYRRKKASEYLKNYIDNYFSNNNVLLLGDFNDDIAESYNCYIDDDIDEDIQDLIACNDEDGLWLSNNIFIDFINDSENYFFADMHIAEGPPTNWSFPNWPSHLDHILITNEILDFDISTNTIKLENYMIGGWGKYESDISDHRPVGISLLPNR